MKGFRAIGMIVGVPGRGFFRIKLDDIEQIVLCRIAGFMEKRHIRIAAADRVAVEICPADLRRGRIVRRL